MKTGQYPSILRRTLRRALLTGTLAAMTQFASADSEFAATWGPNIGTTAPRLEAIDQDGNHQSLDTLKKSNGLLFVFNRSVDW